MEADLFLRDAAQRVVDGLDTLRRPRPAVRHADAGIHHEVGDEARIVDLDDEARVDDGAILLAKRVRERLLVFLVPAIELVLEGGEDVGRRDRRHEDFFVGQPLQRRLEVVDVRLDRGVPLVADRPRAHIHAESAIAAATARPLRDALGPLVIVWERAVLPARLSGIALLPRRPGSFKCGLNLAQTIEEIERDSWVHGRPL